METPNSTIKKPIRNRPAKHSTKATALTAPEKLSKSIKYLMPHRQTVKYRADKLALKSPLHSNSHFIEGYSLNSTKFEI
jgi:hypothetical protein